MLMKMYKLSNYKNGNLQHTQTSSDSNYLREVMQKEVSQFYRELDMYGEALFRTMVI